MSFMEIIDSIINSFPHYDSWGEFILAFFIPVIISGYIGEKAGEAWHRYSMKKEDKAK